MARTSSFSDILDLADHLPLEEKEALIDVLQRRATEERRARIVREVAASEREYRRGKAKAGTVSQIMAEITGVKYQLV